MHEDPNNKPPLDEDTLAHYGVKGMHWGKHKREETTGRKAPAAKPAPPAPKSAAGGETDAYAMAQQYLAASKRGAKPTEKQAVASLNANQKKFHDKFEPSVAKKDDPHKGMTPEQKAKLKKIAIGTAVVGGLAAAVYLSNKGSATKFDTSDFPSGPSAHELANAKFKAMAGNPVSLHQYESAVSKSKSVSWGSGKYIQESSFSHQGFTLPAGHTFHRISTKPEGSFKDGGTYATHNVDDFNRYLSIFRHEKFGADLHHVNFSTTEEFRVPSLVDTLQTMRETLAERMNEPPDAVSHEHVLKTYHELSGGSWSNDDPTTKSFFGNLAKKGYHAIVDEMDAGVIGESPIVIFAHDKLTEKTSQPITKDVIKTAESTLTEITNRKL